MRLCTAQFPKIEAGAGAGAGTGAGTGAGPK